MMLWGAIVYARSEGAAFTFCWSSLASGFGIWHQSYSYCTQFRVQALLTFDFRDRQASATTNQTKELSIHPIMSAEIAKKRKRDDGKDGAFEYERSDFSDAMTPMSMLADMKAMLDETRSQMMQVQGKIEQLESKCSLQDDKILALETRCIDLD